MHDAVPNWTPPERMTQEERRDELAAILCAGLTRMFGQQSSTLFAAGEDSFVDIRARRSVVRRPRIRQRTGG
jgi:hypothetical protein